MRGLRISTGQREAFPELIYLLKFEALRPPPPCTLGRQVTLDAGREEVGPDSRMRLTAVGQPAVL